MDAPNVNDLEEIFGPDDEIPEEEREPEECPSPIVLPTPGYISKGKYKGLTLPRLLSTKPAWQEKVDALIAEIVVDPGFQMHATALAREYAAIRREKDALKAALSECDLRLEAVSQLMQNQYENEDAGAITLANKDNIRVQPEPHTVVLNREEFRLWCIENGLERAMMLPWPSTNSLVRQRLLDGLKEPAGVQAYFRNKIVFKKGEK